MYRFCFGVLSALILIFSSHACLVRNLLGHPEAPDCPALEGSFVYDHIEAVCVMFCTSCGFSFDLPIDRHCPFCPENTSTCAVGTFQCPGTVENVVYEHPNGDGTLPCYKICKMCFRSGISSVGHQIGCPNFSSSDIGVVPNPDDSGGDSGGGSGTGGDSGGDSGGDDVSVPSPPSIPDIPPSELTFPTAPTVKNPPVFDKSKLPEFNIGAFDFLANSFRTRAPVIPVDLGMLTGGFFGMSFVIDFENNEVLRTAISYLRAFELVCICLAALYFLWRIVRTLEI